MGPRVARREAARASEHARTPAEGQRESGAKAWASPRQKRVVLTSIEPAKQTRGSCRRGRWMYLRLAEEGARKEPARGEEGGDRRARGGERQARPPRHDGEKPRRDNHDAPTDGRDTTSQTTTTGSRAARKAATTGGHDTATNEPRQAAKRRHDSQRTRARRPRRQDASADASIMQAPKPANRAPPRRAAIRTDGIPAARLHGARNIIQEESTAGTPCARGPFTWGRAQRCACRRRPRAREPFAWGCAPRGAREREAARAHSLGACARARRGREICARAQRGIVARARSRWRCAPTTNFSCACSLPHQKVPAPT